MQIANDIVVSLMYELRIGNAEGEFVEQTTEDSPLEFIFGTGMMLAEFEKNLEGKTTGDTFSFGIGHLNAYGPVFDEAVVEIPREVFAGHEDMLVEGNVIPMRGPDGQMVQGTVHKSTPEFITMDFNHPMAGKDLYFTGSILNLRQAHPSELEHGHVHHGDDHSHH
jgi:FKBP-type peptidyl-prolyl cis-trans isomerase SlyD